MTHISSNRLYSSKKKYYRKTNHNLIMPNNQGGTGGCKFFSDRQKAAVDIEEGEERLIESNNEDLKSGKPNPSTLQSSPTDIGTQAPQQ